MGIRVGGIDLAGGVLDAEYRIAVLEKILERLLVQVAPDALSQEDLDRFRREAIADLQAKYPDAGIGLKSD